MIKNKEGVILNLSGGGATAARKTFHLMLFQTSLVRYSEILAAELKKFNIRVNALALES